MTRPDRRGIIDTREKVYRMGSATRGRIRVETGHKRVRAYLDGELVADTLAPLYVWEKPMYPAYYIRATLAPTGRTEHSPSRGEAELLDVVTGRSVASAAALRYPDSPIAELRDAVRLDWSAMSEWFEEDEPVYTHPRDPYTRVDILASSRHIRVELDGEVLADSRSPRILFETHLPPRYYLPVTDLRTELLTPSATQTHCPYKGTAAYWSMTINGSTYDDFVWIYRSPLPESQKITGLACFYNEKVDIFIDDVLQERPHTHFG
jgi:uncharacterized protein (DUF427 family)